MKKILILTIIFFAISCKAQTIKAVGDPNSYGEAGIYYKDINNILDPFIGTFIYSNGNTVFKIELQKKINSSRNDIYFQDMLIGAYQFIENGTINANTFPYIYNNNFADGTRNKLYGAVALKGDWPGCDECSTDPNNIWIMGTIKSITNPWVNEMRFKKIVYNGQEALRVVIIGEGAVGRKEGDPLPVLQPFSYPCCGTEFIMIKQ